MGTRVIEQLGYTLLAAALSVATWWLWLGWDEEYQFDASGVASGPWEAWQVIGVAVTLGLIAGLAALRTSFLLVTPAVTIPFTVTWSMHAAARDETGMWGVGAILILGGAGLGTGAVAGIVNAVSLRSRRDHAKTSGGAPS
jgi:hypothetical protein